MNFLSKYLLTGIPRSPDDPVAPEPAAVDPVTPAVDPVPAAIDPPADPDPQPDPAAAVDPAPAPQPAAATMPRWGWDRLSEETNKRQAAEDRERAATERANTLEEIARRLQAAPRDPADPAPQPGPRAAAPAGTPDAVQQEAARIVFARDVQTISDTGFKTYGQRWTDAVGVLNACGANSTEFVASVMDIEPAKAHEIMFQIAQDGERAVALARMTPTRRAAEITRMIMANAPAADPKPADPKSAEPKLAPDPAPAAKPGLSKAPAPAPLIAPHAAAPDVDPTTPEGNDKLDDKQFEAWYKGKYMKRSA